MKFNFDIDGEPEEFRRLFGLPDVTPMQDRMMEEMEKKMAEYIASFSPEELAKMWLSPDKWMEAQNMFFQQMRSGMGMGLGGSQDDRE